MRRLGVIGTTNPDQDQIEKIHQIIKKMNNIDPILVYTGDEDGTEDHAAMACKEEKVACVCMGVQSKPWNGGTKAPRMTYVQASVPSDSLKSDYNWMAGRRQKAKFDDMPLCLNRAQIVLKIVERSTHIMLVGESNDVRLAKSLVESHNKHAYEGSKKKLLHIKSEDNNNG